VPPRSRLKLEWLGDGIYEWNLSIGVAGLRHEILRGGSFVIQYSVRYGKRIRSVDSPIPPDEALHGLRDEGGSYLILRHCSSQVLMMMGYDFTSYDRS